MGVILLEDDTGKNESSLTGSSTINEAMGIIGTGL
jgi:hypothetical protein